MTTFSCTTGMCPDPLRCLAANACEMADLPVVTTAGPRDAGEEKPKRIDEYTLDDYRRGVAKLMKSLSAAHNGA